jgi:hypothetical protein
VVTVDFRLAARLSLGFLWLFTSITSLFWAKDTGLEVLANSGITGSLAEICIVSGSVVDGVIGVWLLLGLRMKECYLTQLVIITTYTLLLTLIDSSFWLHPFGPLTKNIPLLVMIYYLYSEERFGLHKK